MSYSIRYDSMACPKNRKQLPKKQILAAIAVLGLVLCAIGIKLGYLPFVSRVLLPGDPEVTAAALENMVNDLRCGDGLWNAVTAFCREIVENG